MNTSINLELNGKIDSRMIIDYGRLHEIGDEELLSTGNLIVSSVPEEIEYDVTKLIFNRLDIITLNKEQEKLALKISNTIISD